MTTKAVGNLRIYVNMEIGLLDIYFGGCNIISLSILS